MLLFQHYLEAIENRRMEQGGFANHPEGPYRPDATAWAIILLSSQRSTRIIVEHAQNRLLNDQHPDGRISISPVHPEAYWPTPLAILAWHPSPAHHKARERAVHFLLNHSGLHWGKSSDDPIGHNPSILGWPWVSEAHSWVSPTALALIALSAERHRHHPRVESGVRLLMDRQLPAGGWNYGNTTVFDKTLRPFPETTGLALNALAGHVSAETVKVSLDFLTHEAPRLRTPVALGWALLGLKAWGRQPSAMHDWVQETLLRSCWHGGYSTTSLSILFSAAFATRGLEDLLVIQDAGIPDSPINYP